MSLKVSFGRCQQLLKMFFFNMIKVRLFLTAYLNKVNNNDLNFCKCKKQAFRTIMNLGRTFVKFHYMKVLNAIVLSMNGVDVLDKGIESRGLW